MKFETKVSGSSCLGILGFLIPGLITGQVESVVDLSAFPVYAGALDGGTGETALQLTDRMEREVRVDMQTRGGAGYQSDITIRGGIFEGTGLMVGGLALFDPQTGHYFSEIPLDPSFFSGARLLTGVNNAVFGFNSTAGSIDWEWAPIRAGGHAGITLGTDNLFGFQLGTGTINESGVAWQVAAQREAGSGSVENGDFKLERISGRVELGLGTGTLRVFGGYVSKFYGWPSLYTGISGLNETDDYQVSLLGWQWETRQAGQFHRIGGYWRQLDDDYEFNRSSPNTFFEHLTEVWSLQGDGLVESELVDLSYRWVFLKDRIRRSTSLVNGDFMDRQYGELSVLGQRRLSTRLGELIPYAGIGLETTDEDQTVASPQAGARLTGSLETGAWEVYAEYSSSSQVPGYTALNSATSGLFGGNPDLGRERARTIEAGLFTQKGSLSGKVVVFHRRDEDLVDWVFDADSPNARQAAAVDITVKGIEGWMRWEQEKTAVEIGYAWLDKDPRYKSAGGDASFYALNYARHRILLTLEQTFVERITIRLQGAYRNHLANALRSGPDEAVTVNFEAAVEAFPAEGWRLLVRLENFTDEDFQSIPGTPGSGREGRASLVYSW